MIAFLLDQGLPRSTALALHAKGLAAEHVGDIGLAKATDEEILEEAKRRQLVAVTLDADFHAILAATKAQSPSVIRIRIEGLKGQGVADVLEKVVAAAPTELQVGAAITVTQSRIRIRLLPLP